MEKDFKIIGWEIIECNKEQIYFIGVKILQEREGCNGRRNNRNNKKENNIELECDD